MINIAESRDEEITRRRSEMRDAEAVLDEAGIPREAHGRSLPLPARVRALAQRSREAGAELVMQELQRIAGRRGL